MAAKKKKKRSTKRKKIPEAKRILLAALVAVSKKIDEEDWEEAGKLAGKLKNVCEGLATHDYDLTELGIVAKFHSATSSRKRFARFEEVLRKAKETKS